MTRLCRSKTNTKMRNEPQQIQTTPRWSLTDRGFTLIEVLVAMAIIAIVVIAIFRLNSQTIDMTNATRFHTLAPLLAQSKLAEIESRTLEDATSDAGDFGETHPGFQWQVTMDPVLSEILGESVENLKKIDLAITYNDSGAIYKITLYRFFHE
jgi:general secretion pathway protein I